MPSLRLIVVATALILFACASPASAAPQASTLLNLRELRRLLSGKFEPSDDSFAHDRQSVCQAEHLAVPGAAV